jgi:hypothetical protein
VKDRLFPECTSYRRYSLFLVLAFCVCHEQASLFPMAQFCTSMMWGVISDKTGRKVNPLSPTYTA